ncbi:MAG: hypothetical protein RL619_918 [Bacteroidota bacterium]|jgi:hypothetical protein
MMSIYPAMEKFKVIFFIFFTQNEVSLKKVIFIDRKFGLN